VLIGIGAAIAVSLTGTTFARYLKNREDRRVVQRAVQAFQAASYLEILYADLSTKEDKIDRIHRNSDEYTELVGLLKQGGAYPVREKPSDRPRANRLAVVGTLVERGGKRVEVMAISDGLYCTVSVLWEGERIDIYRVPGDFYDITGRHSIPRFGAP
jgi:hypothetical protein